MSDGVVGVFWYFVFCLLECCGVGTLVGLYVECVYVVISGVVVGV